MWAILGALASVLTFSIRVTLKTPLTSAEPAALCPRDKSWYHLIPQRSRNASRSHTGCEGALFSRCLFVYEVRARHCKTHIDALPRLQMALLTLYWRANLILVSCSDRNRHRSYHRNVLSSLAHTTLV
jgi:hypothetical protein